MRLIQIQDKWILLGSVSSVAVREQAGWKTWSALSTRFNFLIASVLYILILHFQKSKVKLHSALPEKENIMDSYYMTGKNKNIT